MLVLALIFQLIAIAIPKDVNVFVWKCDVFKEYTESNLPSRCVTYAGKRLRVLDNFVWTLIDWRV